MKDLKTVGRLYRYFQYIMSKKQRRQAVAVLLLILVGSFMELLGVSVILPFIQAFMEPQTLEGRWYVKVISSVFHIKDPENLLVFLGVLIALVYIVKNVFLSFVAYVRSRYSSALQRSLTVEMLSSYMERPYSFFVESDIGVLLNGVNLDVTGVHNFILTFFIFVSEITTVILIFVYLVSIDRFLAFGIMFLAALCATLLTLMVKKTISRLTIAMRTANKKRNRFVVQIINNIKDVIVFDKKELFIGQYEEECRKFSEAQAKSDFINTLPERIIEAICVSGIFIFIIFRIKMGTGTVEFISGMSVFAMGAFRMLPLVSRVSKYIQIFIRTRPMVEETYKNIRNARTHMEEVRLATSATDRRDIEFKNELAVRDIDWKYEKGNEKVLNGLSLDVHKGDMIGIIGESGSGKSTLGDILLGLYTPQAGGIYMDGTDIREIPKVWRRTVSYVPQMLLLFNASIRFNISFSDDKKDDEELWRILGEVSMDSFVRSLPEGLDSNVGDRGIKLSGGQRQRIAIARALYSKPEILILDEATSALDTETEAAVVGSINMLAKKMTLIIIAHRLSTLKSCNKVFRIENGKAVEEDKRALGIETEEQLPLQAQGV